MSAASGLVDGYGRRVTYLRLSVTDRCDLRCTYCMSERMSFLPRSEVLSLEELARVAHIFIDRGVDRVRITGGEPLVRKGVLGLFEELGSRLGRGLQELCLTTNGMRLSDYAEELFRCGVRRVNVSLDSLDTGNFFQLTRGGDLSRVLAGIEAARCAGLAVKINTVVLKSLNADEIPEMVEWAHSRDMEMTLIEVMPLGETGQDRFDQYIPLTEVREGLEARWSLEELSDRTGGPARYVRIAETGGRLGLITPLTQNFCAGCNRVRVSCSGRLYMCLGQGDHVDLREALRSHPGDMAALHKALDEAMLNKPEKHDFFITGRGQAPSLRRHMSVTGG